MTWYEIDMNWYGISALRAMGLAWDISLPKLGREKAIRPVAAPETPAVIAPIVTDALPQESEGD
jgi:hypothetical protein